MLTIEHKKRCIEAHKAKQAFGVDAVSVDDSGLSDTTKEYIASVTLTSLDADLETLSGIKNRDEKNEFKKSVLLPKYMPEVQAYIAEGQHKHYLPLVYVAMWSFDVGDLTKALELFEIAIAQQQPKPQHFNRSLTDLVVESFAEWALDQVKKKESVAPYLNTVCDYVSQGQWLVDNPIVSGKAFRSLGLYHESIGEYKEALDAFTTAQEYNEGAGCKGRIKDMKTKLGL